MTDLYGIEVKTIEGKSLKMAEFQGRTLLIVNVASKCGFTNQYTGLEKLYQSYKDKGFLILGFPCNQFGAQEPGDETEIKNFCSLTYEVTFPMFAKVDVNGEHAHPLFSALKSAAPGILGTEGIKWNFTKFLVNSSGAVVKRYAPQDKPESMASDIEAAINQGK